MPENCFECPLKDMETDFPNCYCSITGDFVNGDEDMLAKRPPCCPLCVLTQSH